MSNYLAFVGIDFGTSGTTFSYWFPKSNLDDTESIKVKKWEGEGTANKTSTEIILDENLKNILAFGRRDCETFINQGKKNFLYFSDIKMYLYKNQKDIPDNYSKGKYSIVKVISKILERIRDEAIRELSYKQKSFQDLGDMDKKIEKIKWVITVPAIWSDFSKDMMLKSAKLAKLIKEDDDPSNFFALEPEAAACYYAKSENAEKDILKYPYIICDLGGGTCDITTHERLEDKEKNIKIIELYPPTGGANGSTEINKFFLRQILFNSLFSAKTYEIFQEKIRKEDDDSVSLKEDMQNINTCINKFKETFELKKVENNEGYLMKLDIFKEMFEEAPKIEELVNNYNKNTRKGWEIKVRNIKNWTLEFPYQIMKDLLQELIVDKASDYIEKIVKYLKEKKSKEIKAIIFAGGASANISIIQLFEMKFPNLTILVSDDPELAIAKGAIYFAKNPYSIAERIARYSIGIYIEGKWEKKFDDIKGAIKFFDNKKNKWLCLNRFQAFYKKFESINVSDGGRIFKCGMNTEHSNIEFYKSDFDGPVYVVNQLDENNLSLTQKFGVLEFTVEDFDEKQDGVEIHINFGGTFISAKIIYLKTKKEKYGVFNFI